MSESSFEFEQAFGEDGSGCIRDCNCGITTYNPDGGWDWEEGELESLESNPKATAVDHSVASFNFFGKTYVFGCSCGADAYFEQWIRQHRVNFIHYLKSMTSQLRADAKELIEQASAVDRL